VSFAVTADAYDRFMGRYSVQLSPQFADFADVRSGRVIDGGCGSGAVPGELVNRLGPTHVSAIDPSESFVAAVRERRAPSVSGEDGRAALELIQAIYRAAESGQVVHLPLVAAHR